MESPLLIEGWWSGRKEPPHYPAVMQPVLRFTPLSL